MSLLDTLTSQPQSTLLNANQEALNNFESSQKVSISSKKTITKVQKPKSQAFTTYLPNDLTNEIRRIAKQSKVSINEVIKQALTRFIQE
jgi:predicted HicB family RNase H-like nuclease